MTLFQPTAGFHCEAPGLPCTRNASGFSVVTSRPCQVLNRDTGRAPAE